MSLRGYLRHPTGPGSRAFSGGARLGFGSLGSLIAALITDRLFCNLLAEVPTSLEHNASVEATYAFKVRVFGAIAALGASVAQADGALTPARPSTSSCIAACWPAPTGRSPNPAPTLAEVYSTYPSIAAHCVDFPALRRTLDTYLAGLRTRAEP